MEHYQDNDLINNDVLMLDHTMKDLKMVSMDLELEKYHPQMIVLQEPIFSV